MLVAGCKGFHGLLATIESSDTMLPVSSATGTASGVQA